MNRLFINKQRIIILAVLIPFTLFTDYAILQINSLSELWLAFTAHAMVEQVALDFLISFAVVCLWVWQDAKSKGVRPLPYMILMVCTGSIGLLFYMFRHVYNKPSIAEQSIAQSAQHA